MIATVAAAGLVLTACGSGDDSNASDDTTVVPDEGAGDDAGGEERDDGAEGSQTTDVGAGDGASGDDLFGSVFTVATAETASQTFTPGDSAEAHVKFEENGDVGGFAGCNSFGGKAKVGDGTITFSQIFSTQKACSGDAGELEGAVMGLLDGEVSYEVDGDTVTLTSGDNTLVLERGE